MGLIFRPGKSYRSVVPECDLEGSIMRRLWPTKGCCTTEKEINYHSTLPSFNVHYYFFKREFKICTLRNVHILWFLVHRLYYKNLLALCETTSRCHVIMDIK